MALLCVIGALLLIAIVLAAVWLDRWSVPVILVALGAGILFGSDVLNLWHFDNMGLVNHAANLALVFILFHGGFGTLRSDLRAVALPAIGLATWGVVLTALATFAVLYGVLRWDVQRALLLAAIISSTDAAAIFSILRRQSLPQRLASTIEIESAANDPTAILLTVAAIEAITVGHAGWLGTAGLFVWKFTAAPLAGWFLARGAIWLFRRLEPQDRGHYYVLSLGVVLGIYGLVEVMQASGMLAVFVAGHVMGNRSFVHKQGVANFTSALSTVANICMFALLGLQVFPHRWSTLWLDGLVLFLVITFLARPMAVLVGTLGMGFPWRHRLFMAWAGLRGAVPIILATIPLAAGVPGASQLFDVVFAFVVFFTFIQAPPLPWIARLLKVSTGEDATDVDIEFAPLDTIKADMMQVHVPEGSRLHGVTIRELRLPRNSVVSLIVREN